MTWQLTVFWRLPPERTVPMKLSRAPRLDRPECGCRWALSALGPPHIDGPAEGPTGSSPPSRAGLDPFEVRLHESRWKGRAPQRSVAQADPDQSQDCPARIAVVRSRRHRVWRLAKKKARPAANIFLAMASALAGVLVRCVSLGGCLAVAWRTGAYRSRCFASRLRQAPMPAPFEATHDHPVAAWGSPPTRAMRGTP